MPTASTAGLLSLNNLGSLTTTFTAPSSCATASGFMRTGFADTRLSPGLIYPVDNCDWRPDFPEDCLPHGDDISSQWASLNINELSTLLNYYSPGLQCPDTWSTVGVYAPADHSNDTTVTKDAADLGIFSPTAFASGRPGESTSVPVADYTANMFTSALASTETAIACCPSGYKVDPYAGCYSTLPLSRLASKTACVAHVTGTASIGFDEFRRTFEFWGETRTVNTFAIMAPTETEQYALDTVTLDESGWPQETGEMFRVVPNSEDGDSYEALAVVAPLYLVKTQEDDGGSGESRENDNKDGDGDDGQEESGNGGDDDDSAAGRLSPGASWGSIAGVLATWGFSVAAGVGLLVA
ncbi:hypothetical protein LIA77_08942 [Sarocladium implicatum]|nr:hypothetical protein LIA77_08942 [Sarocladium implicatum]